MERTGNLSEAVICQSPQQIKGAGETNRSVVLPIEYSFLQDSDICYARYIGLVTAADLEENYGRYLSDRNYVPGRPELIDLSECDFSALTYASLSPLAAFVDQANVAAETTTLTCLYGPTNTSFGTARIYEAITAPMKGLMVFVTRSQRDAMRFLQQPYSDIDTFLQTQTVVPACPAETPDTASTDNGGTEEEDTKQLSGDLTVREAPRQARSSKQ